MKIYFLFCFLKEEDEAELYTCILPVGRRPLPGQLLRAWALSRRQRSSRDLTLAHRAGGVPRAPGVPSRSTCQTLMLLGSRHPRPQGFRIESVCLR